MHRGYVKLWRRIDESAISRLSPLNFRVWCWILTNATHQPLLLRREGLTLQPGELTTTYRSMAQALAWTENRRVIMPTVKQLRKNIESLVKLEMLSQGHEPGQGYLHLKVLHWEEYQGQPDLTRTGTRAELGQDKGRTGASRTRTEEHKHIEKEEQTLLSESDDSSPRENSNGKGKKENIAALATGIWEHWKAVYPERSRMTFTNDRRAKVEARLREGISPETIKAATERSRMDSWWNGEKDGEWKADLAAICGKGRTVENLAFDARSVVTDPQDQRIGRLRQLRSQYGDSAVRAMCESEELWKEVCGA